MFGIVSVALARWLPPKPDWYEKWYKHGESNLQSTIKGRPAMWPYAPPEWYKLWYAKKDSGAPPPAMWPYVVGYFPPPFMNPPAPWFGSNSPSGYSPSTAPSTVATR